MWIALLRGINVGGKNKLPMAQLVELFESLGCRDVRTYIQSGNVIFRAAATLARKLPRSAADEIRARHGLEVPVVLRRRRDLQAAVERSPFADRADPAHLGIAFLAELPRPGDVAALDPDRSPPDGFEVIGREIHLHLPGGVARTKLTNRYFDSKLGTVSTVRNWRTVHKLIRLAGG